MHKVLKALKWVLFHTIWSFLSSSGFFKAKSPKNQQFGTKKSQIQLNLSSGSSRKTFFYSKRTFQCQSSTQNAPQNSNTVLRKQVNPVSHTVIFTYLCCNRKVIKEISLKKINKNANGAVNDRGKIWKNVAKIDFSVFRISSSEFWTGGWVQRLDIQHIFPQITNLNCKKIAKFT